MRLNKVDGSEWLTIAALASNLCDRIADDTATGTEDDWPDDSLAVAAWRDLTTAALRAMFLSKDPTLTMSGLAAIVPGGSALDLTEDEAREVADGLAAINEISARLSVIRGCALGRGRNVSASG